MEKLLLENHELRRDLVKAMMKQKNCSKTEPPPALGSLLNELNQCALSNAHRKPNGWRYTEKLKEFSSLLYLVSGLKSYEILCHNLPFPKVSSVQKELHSNEVIREGEFRFEPLVKFLELHDLPKKFVACEDATKIAGRIQYDGKTNQVVGFILSLDDNGIPIAGSYPATSAKRMAEYFEASETSNYAYVIMAQPLSSHAPSFILCMFGTNNKFKATQVEKRWQWMETEALRHGLEIVGYASDGDTRLMKSMIYRTVTPSPLPHNWKFFQAKKKQAQLCFQDHVHEVVKLKTRCLMPSILMPVGEEHEVSRGHLIALINDVSRDQHDLSASDINCKDKMNFRSVQKMSDPKVSKLLRSHVPGSEGTAMYMEMINELLSAYMNPSLLPLERVEMLWKWVFFLRMWRSWLERKEGYSLQHNFISSNTYSCIELNAHALIQAIIKFRDDEEHHLFLPWLMSSQPCEESFRSLRSTGTTHCGVVSFSILELHNRIRRIDLMTSRFKKLEKDYNFPRHHKSLKKMGSTCHIPVSLPEDFEIEAAVSSALQTAMQIAKKFKIIKKPSPTYVPACHLKPISEMKMHSDSSKRVSVSENDDDDSEEEEEENCDCELCRQNESDDSDDDQDRLYEVDDVEEDEYLVSTGAIGVKTFENVNVTETSPYVIVVDGTGKQCVIKKSTFLYLQSQGKIFLSSDRNLRYQSSNVDHRTSAARKPFYSGLAAPTRKETVNLSDWCAFRSEDKSVVVGRINAFSYLSGSTWKNQEYSLISAPTAAPKKNARGLGVACSWFKIERNKTLSSINMDLQGYYSIEHYMCTLPKPIFARNVIRITCTMKQILEAN